MIRRPPRSTRSDTLFPYTTLFRSARRGLVCFCGPFVKDIVMSKNKIIISCAITGSIHTPSMSPYLPVTAEEIADSALGAAEAGAAIVHLHRSEERRVGTECVRTGRSRRSAAHTKKKDRNKQKQTK